MNCDEREAKLLLKRQKVIEQRQKDAENRLLDLKLKAQYNKQRKQKQPEIINEVPCEPTTISYEKSNYSLRSRTTTQAATTRQTKNTPTSKKNKQIVRTFSITTTSSGIENETNTDADLNQNKSMPNDTFGNTQNLGSERVLEKHVDVVSKQQKKLNTVRKREAKFRRKIKVLETEIKRKNRLIGKWKKKYYRLLHKNAESDEILDNVKKIERGSRNEVHKNLVQFEVLKKQIRDKQLSLKNEKERSVFNQCLAGKVVKKYRRMRKFTFVSNYLLKTYENSENIKFKRLNTKKKLYKDKIVEKVQNFLEKDENSSMAPGVKDTITKNGITKRKRYFCDSINNLYLKFKEEEKIKISRSSFFAVRPFWIVQKQLTGRDTCLCKPHANMGLLVRKLFQLKMLPSISVTSFAKSRVCSMFSKECFFGECEKCDDKKVHSKSSQEPTSYYKWLTEEVSRPGAKGLIYKVKITSKVKVDCTMNELISEVNSQIPEFFKHVYITYHQHKATDCIKEGLKKGEVLMYIDFSENYICKCHEEIQSAHFGASKKQLSLHTGAFYYRDSSFNLVCKSFCSASECLRHDAAAVWAHLDPVFKLIKDNVPDLTTVHIQSDGPSTQYKNKTNFYLFKEYCRNEHLTDATWSLSSPGHGKSVADGTGGSVKGVCDRVVAQGSDITSAEDLVRTINSSSSKIHAFLILKSDIEKIDAKIPDSLKAAPNTKKIFQVTWSKSDMNKLFLNELSCSYCVVNKLNQPSCIHFQLQPNSCTFMNSGGRKRSINDTEEKSVRKKKKINHKVLSEPITEDSKKTKRKGKNKNNHANKTSNHVDKTSSDVNKKKARTKKNKNLA